jgi:hypothetical protein
MPIEPLNVPNFSARPFTSDIDFSPLANLGNVAREAQKQQKLSQLGNLLASGKIGYDQAAGMAADIGDLSSSLQFSKLSEAQKEMARQEAASGQFMALFGGGPSSVGGSSPVGVPPSTARPVAAPVVASSVPKDEEAAAAVPAAVPPTPAAVPAAAPPTPAAVPAAAPPTASTAYDRLTDPSMIPRYAAMLSNPHLATDQKQLAATMLGKALDAAKPSDRSKYLQDLKDNDPKLANKSLMDIEMMLKGPLVQIMPGEKAQDVKVGEEIGTLQNNALKAGFNAPKIKGTLDIMENALKDPNFYSGAGSQGVLAWKRAASALGIEGAEAATPNEVFQKMSNKLVTDTLAGDKGGAGLGTGISNADRDFIGQTVPNLQNTPSGNLALIQLHRKLADRDLEIAKMTRDYARTHNGRIDYEFLQEVSDYQEAHPLFKDFKFPSGALGPSSPPSGGTGTPSTGSHKNIPFTVNP